MKDEEAPLGYAPALLTKSRILRKLFSYSNELAYCAKKAFFERWKKLKAEFELELELEIEIELKSKILRMSVHISSANGKQTMLRLPTKRQST